MAQIWEYIKIALMNIKSNKGRSVLTMLGIVIGIASVIMVMAIGNGVRGQINDELESIGSGMVELYLDTTLETTTIRFSQEDFVLIQDRVDHVKGVTPVIGGWGSAEGPKGNFEARVMAGTEGLEYYSGGGGPVIKGRYFTEEEANGGSRVCVISEGNAMNMFGTTDVLGMSFEVTLYGISQELTIIGIREDNATSFVNTGSSQTINIELPIAVMSNDFYFWTEEFSDIIVFADDTRYCTEVAQNAVKVLEGKYGVWGENQIIVNNISDMSAEMDSILGILTMFVSFVAAISLLVGGIGVMNILEKSVSVNHWVRGQVPFCFNFWRKRPLSRCLAESSASYWECLAVMRYVPFLILRRKQKYPRLSARPSFLLRSVCSSESIRPEKRRS